VQATTSTAADAATTSSPAADATTTSSESANLAHDLFALITYLHKSCTADLFEALGAVELSLSQVKLLHHLEDRSRELTLKQAAEVVHVSLPAASRMVDDLVQRGFVARQEDVEDRRMKRVRITDAGDMVIRRLNAARLVGLEEFVERLGDDERQVLGQLLDRLLERPEIACSRPQAAKETP
jgi:DNA-binding MarR family transcriptional regulator